MSNKEKEYEIEMRGFGDGLEDGRNETRVFVNEVFSRPGMEKAKAQFYAELDRMEAELADAVNDHTR